MAPQIQEAPQIPSERSSGEKWLTSPVRVFVLALLVAALLAAFTTLQVVELENARGREIAFSRVYVYRFATWLFWAVALVPIVWLFRYLRRRFGSLLLALFVHLALSWFVSGVALDWRTEMEQRMIASVLRPGQEEGPGRGGGEAPEGGPRGEPRPDGEPGGRFDPESDEPLREGPPRTGPRRRLGGQGLGGQGLGGQALGGQALGGQGAGPGGGPGAGPGGGALRDLRRSARRARNAEARAVWQRAQRGREIAYYWILVGLGMGVGAFVETRNQERRAIVAELRSEKLRTQLAQSQIGTLEAQVQPHFLFNALHAVGGLIRAGEDRDALKTLSSLGALLRRTLEHGALQRVRLEEELEVVERYLDVERIRLAERLRLQIDVDEGAKDALVPSLFLLPLVENAVKYAIAPRSDGGRVSVSARASGGSLILEVADDGPGFPAEILADPEASETSQDRKHIGLANCRRRIEALYDERASLEFLTAKGGGALVRLRLPLEPAHPGESRANPEV